MESEEHQGERWDVGNDAGQCEAAVVPLALRGDPSCLGIENVRLVAHGDLAVGQDDERPAIVDRRWSVVVHYDAASG
jgi:hypothetical protein